MMPLHKLGPVLLACLVVAGCTSYPAIGMFEDQREVFRGRAAPGLDMEKNMFVDEGVFSMRGDVSNTLCNGRVGITHLPTSIQCRGQKGDVSAKCSDGRLLNGTWSARSCEVGSGQGEDSNGTAFAFTFGLPEDRAKRNIEKMLGISVGESKLSDTERNR